MMEQELIREICVKEGNSVLYDIHIGGIPAYSMIRGLVRYRIIESKGLPIMKLRSPLNGRAAVKSAIVSFWQFLKLWVSGKKYPSIYYAFARVDKIGDYYLDKFTDPIIEQCEKEGNYLILDYGRAGVHPKPRVHAEHIIYLDFFSGLSRVYGMVFHGLFYHKFKREFDILFSEIKNAFGLDLDKTAIVRELAGDSLYVGFLQRVFRKVSAERVIGPARAFMAAPFIAAKRQGMKRFELQHGITYGETVLYSGFRDGMIVPDRFLAFGDNKPSDVYGIDEARIVDVGWAMPDYLDKLSYDGLGFGPKDVLVVSDPAVSLPMLKAVTRLAKENPDRIFYFRPHPHEIITQEHRNLMTPFPNIKIQDRSINISIVLHEFNLIVGENSTVLYEALAIRKKVGRLFFEGLAPLYADDGDRDCFWEIRGQDDFAAFVEGDVSEKKSRCIYSPFDKRKYLDITGVSA